MQSTTALSRAYAEAQDYSVTSMPCSARRACRSTHSLPLVQCDHPAAFLPLLLPLLVLLQIKQEAELRGHTESVTNLTWHPTHPDKLASMAQPEKSVR